MRAPIAIALDVSSFEEAAAVTKLLSSDVEMMKVGLQSYLRDGNQGVKHLRSLMDSCKLFLDLKLHDIPQTVASAVKSIKPLNPDVLTVHASGGKAMMKAAVAEAEEIDIAAVTILTSLSLDDVAVFSNHSIPDLVFRLAENAAEAGCRALVCSPHEVQQLRTFLGNEIKLIVPGVRMPGDAVNDQTRISSPKEAIDAGADILVMGRSIIGAIDPKAKLDRVKNSLAVSN